MNSPSVEVVEGATGPGGPRRFPGRTVAVRDDGKKGVRRERGLLRQIRAEMFRLGEWTIT
jgi:hypothetical protein